MIKVIVSPYRLQVLVRRSGVSFDAG